MTDTYFVSAADAGTSTLNLYTFISATNTIQVYPDPTVSTNINSITTMDIGQNVVISAIPSGGTGSFSYSWTSTGSCPGFTSSTSNTFVYVPISTTNNCVFNVKITDTGISAGASPASDAVAQTSTNTVVVNSELSKIILTPLSTTMDVGQSITFNAVVCS